MKIRMLDDIYCLHGHYNVKRGDVLDIDEDNANRYVHCGLATEELKGDLPHAYVVTPESKSREAKVLQAVAQSVPEEARRTPGAINLRARPAGVKREGWGV